MRRALHPRSVPGEPQAVRWVTDVEIPVGRVLAAPGTLGPMLEYGVIPKAFVERGGVWTWLAPEHSWTDHGPRIRDAVAAAIGLDGWRVEEGSGELLGLITREILEGELKSYIASHGGQITVDSVEEGVVRLDFGGACEGCPAAGATLHDRIEQAIRRRYPALSRVERTGGEHKPRGWLGLPVPGRGR